MKRTTWTSSLHCYGDDTDCSLSASSSTVYTAAANTANHSEPLRTIISHGEPSQAECCNEQIPLRLRIPGVKTIMRGARSFENLSKYHSSIDGRTFHFVLLFNLKNFHFIIVYLFMYPFLLFMYSTLLGGRFDQSRELFIRTHNLRNYLFLCCVER